MRRVHVLSDASKKFNKKLAPKYEGSFKIAEVKLPKVYILYSADQRSSRLSIIHVSELKLYVPPRKLSSRKFFFIYFQDNRCTSYYTYLFSPEYGHTCCNAYSLEPTN